VIVRDGGRRVDVVTGSCATLCALTTYTRCNILANGVRCTGTFIYNAIARGTALSTIDINPGYTFGNAAGLYGAIASNPAFNPVSCGNPSSGHFCCCVT
ncbi:unnamed protein product, partial [Rotaria sordida]